MIIGLLHRFTENIGLKSMSNMHIFTNECNHLYCNKKIIFKSRSLRMSGPGRAFDKFGEGRAFDNCPGRAGRPGSLGVAGRKSLISPGVAGPGARVGDYPGPCQPCAAAPACASASQGQARQVPGTECKLLVGGNPASASYVPHLNRMGPPGRLGRCSFLRLEHDRSFELGIGRWLNLSSESVVRVSAMDAGAASAASLRPAARPPQAQHTRQVPCEELQD